MYNAHDVVDAARVTHTDLMGALDNAPIKRVSFRNLPGGRAGWILGNPRDYSGAVVVSDKDRPTISFASTSPSLVQLVAEASHEKRRAVAHSLTQILQHEDGVMCDTDAEIVVPDAPNPAVWITFRAQDHPEFGSGRMRAFWERDSKRFSVVGGIWKWLSRG